MAEKQKQYNLALDPGKVRGANISRYSDGYSYASMSFKMNDKEYMNVSYEWQGSDIPEFAMSVMEIMQSLGKKEAASVTVEDIGHIERLGKVLTDKAAKMKKEVDPEMDEEDENEEDDMNDPKKKKGKKKKC